MPSVHPDDFRGALGSWAAGVTVVTTKHEGLVYGITVSSFSSLSMEPTLIIVCLQNSNHLARLVTESQKFAVSILADGQQAVSNYFSKSGRDPVPAFDPEIETIEWHTGAPIIANSLAHLDCELQEAISGGDHTIAVGRVLGAAYRPEALPLLYFRRSYRTLTEPE
ncbi:MAG: flavin reductase family protein [Tepidiformaceae bacterium]